MLVNVLEPLENQLDTWGARRERPDDGRSGGGEGGGGGEREEERERCERERGER